MVSFRLAIFGAITLFCACPGLPEQAVAESQYDQPLEVRHVRLKPDRVNPQAKREVACFSYPHFLVKQVDLGEVGADRLSIIPSGGKTIPCRQAKERNETMVKLL